MCDNPSSGRLTPCRPQGKTLCIDEASAIGIYVSPFGVISNKGKPGKWQLIVKQSSPSGGSMNDGVGKELCSFTYTSVDASVDATADRVVDITQAYRMILVHPEDRYQLGVQWEGVINVDKTLLFGLGSAPLISSAVADALQWMMLRRGKLIEHYVHQRLYHSWRAWFRQRRGKQPAPKKATLYSGQPISQVQGCEIRAVLPQAALPRAAPRQETK